MNISEMIDKITEGFIVAALWADGIPAEDDPMELGGLEHMEMDEVGREFYRTHVSAFVIQHADLVEFWLDHPERYQPQDCGPLDYFGHTLYLSGAGHGVSFTDRNIGELGVVLDRLVSYRFEGMHPYQIEVDGDIATSEWHIEQFLPIKEYA